MSSHQWTSQPDTAWQKTQTKLAAHVLQTSPWGTFQTALGRQVLYAHATGWSWLAILEKSRFGNRLYCPYGPTATSVVALKSALQALTSCAKAHNATYLRIEPQGPFTSKKLLSLGLRPAHRSIQPHYTLIKNLTPPEDQLIAEMTATNRNLHRTAHKKSLSFSASTTPSDIKIFLDMMHQVAQHNQITIHPDNYYDTMAKILMPLGTLKLYIAKHSGKPVATSLVLDSPHTRYYAHAASVREARKLHPGPPLLTHMILDAKKQGLKEFDFYGIAPPDQPKHPWAGFTSFKKSFGGQPKDMHGTWELPIKKLPYHSYRLLASLAKR